VLFFKNSTLNSYLINQLKVLNISKDGEKFLFFKKFSRKYKNEGDYNHNYFLADLLFIFSPYYRFTPEQVLEKWKEYTEDSDFLSMYVHIPFCIQRCEYCVYRSNKVESRECVERYVENLLEEIDFFGKNLDRRFNTLYFGGGTPSILSAENIDRLLSRIRKYFSFEEKGMRNFEMNPVTCTEEKLDVIEKHGINRISFGVQSTSREVLEKANRGYQDLDIVKKSFEMADKRSFSIINMDLILGLQNSDKEKFINSFEDLIELEPSSICVYPLQPNQDLLNKRGMTEEEFFEKIGKRIEEVKEPLRIIAEEKGYNVPSTPNPRGANSWMFERKKMDEVFDYNYYFQSDMIDGCLGFGVFQESYISSVLSYNREVENPNFRLGTKIYGGTLQNERDHMRKFILDEFEDGNTLSLRAFKEKFGYGVEEKFEDAIKSLKEIGVLYQKDYELILDLDSPLDTFAACYFFFDEAQIKHQIREEAEKNGWDRILEELNYLI